MYSPTKENMNVRMGDNKKRYIIRGRRKIKSKDAIKTYKPASISK